MDEGGDGEDGGGDLYTYGGGGDGDGGGGVGGDGDGGGGDLYTYGVEEEVMVMVVVGIYRFKEKMVVKIVEAVNCNNIEVVGTYLVVVGICRHIAKAETI
ncbi:hypothetical protein ACOSQ2_017506 [Xanthoceras sorbifolium]